jgi:hypothetical protein
VRFQTGGDTRLRFRFVLARELGMTVGRLEREMTTRELIWWGELYQQEYLEQKD